MSKKQLFQLECQTLTYADDTGEQRLPAKSKTFLGTTFGIADAWEKSYLVNDVRQDLAATFQPQDGYEVKTLADANLGGLGWAAIDRHGRLVETRTLKPRGEAEV